MRKMLVLFAILLCTLVGGVVHAQVKEIPADIFQWVQSSSRTDYYFNKEQICFYKDVRGQVDTNRLICPVLKIYDDLMKNDVISKRRWNGKSLEGFGDLAGVAEYLEFNIKENTVRIKQVDYLDSTFTTIEENKPNQVVKLAELSPKSLDAKFYNAILDYGQRHQLMLAERVNSKLDENVKTKILAAQEEYVATHKKEETK